MKFAQKLYYLFFAFFAVLFAGMVLYSYWMRTSGLKYQLKPQFDKLSDILALQSKSLIENDNRGGLDDVLDTVIRKKGSAGQIAYMYILDERKVVYYSREASEQDFLSQNEIDTKILQTLETTQQRSFSHYITTNIGEVYDVSILFKVNLKPYIFRIGYNLGTGFSLPASVILMLFTILGVLTVVFVWIVSRIIIHPVEDLTREANQITSGSKQDFLTARLRNDEIGDLARALHVLLKELESKRKQLAEQEKLAVLGKGTGRMTHTMSNLLNPVDHYSKIIHDELSDCQTTEQFSEAIQNIEKHINLVRKDLKQLRNAIPDKPYREKYPLSVLFETALSRLLIPKNIKIEKHADAALYIWVDPEQFTDVFYNLFLNAFQAMPKGGELFISTELQKKNVIIKIRDTGVGIPQENLANIFQFFYSTKKDGMGIGLSSSAEIIRSHGGSISVNSEEKTGTTFIIKLPTTKPLE